MMSHMDVSCMAPVQPENWGNAEWPLGAHLTEDGATFAVYAPDASRVQLDFFPQALGADAVASFVMSEGPDGVWRAQVRGVSECDLYGFRVWGSNWPWDPAWKPGSSVGFVSDIDEHGNRFNPNKVMFDPYAREITHTVYSDAILETGLDGGAFGTGPDDYRGAPRREADTARIAPKGVILRPTRPVFTKPRLPGEKAAIYEASVSQLVGHPSIVKLGTLLSSEPGFEDVMNIPEEYLGTYRGVGMMAPYLKALGITTLELLPIHETNQSESAREGHTNSWGYMTLSFFAPNRKYAYDKSLGGPTREFQQMMAAFHEAGLEVYLDVVYNHTAEGGNWGGDPNTVGFTSLGGFAAAEYYVMTASHALVDGATGTSNQLNYSSPVAQQLVLDSLEHWTVEMGADGFRFDLATVLGRKPNDADREDWDNQKRFYTDHPLLTAIAEFAEEQHIEVIAEAWDLWGYEVGNFPQGWAEWNGRYRDAVRRFAKGDGNAIEFLDVVNGDHAHFADNGGPQKTINFIDAHDGFNMADLVSYQEKNNDQPYPFGPSDGGSDDNLSWDCGGSQELRRQRIRNFLTILYLSRGVPMFVAGDEFGRTQNGNNNPWEIDSVAMWNNYTMIPTNAPQQVPVAPGVTDASYHDNLGTFETEPGVNGLFRFTRFLAHLRQRHESLQQKQYGDLVPDDRDVSYLFHTPSMEGYPQDGDRALSVYINSPGDNFLMMVNMADAQVTFNAPTPAEGRVWRRLIDTGVWAEPAENSWPEGEGMVLDGATQVQPWSVVVWHDSPVLADDAG